MTPEERVKEILKDYLYSPYMEYRPTPKDNGVREALLRHIREAIAEEREACAIQCEEFYSCEGIAQKCADVIRNRKGD